MKIDPSKLEGNRRRRKAAAVRRHNGFLVDAVTDGSRINGGRYTSQEISSFRFFDAYRARYSVLVEPSGTGTN
ncbi:MAG: hypothetical protein ABIH82_02445, partial [Candidatus Woesearchaeota archaeon]